LRNCSGRGHGGSSDNSESNRVHFHDILPINCAGAYPKAKITE